MKGLLSKTKSFLKRSSPTILTCFSIVGVVGTTVLAVKATPKAVELIKNDSRRNHDGDPYAYTKKEAIASAWKCYIPAAAFGVSTIACIVSANILNRRQQAALTSAYVLLNNSYKEYKNKLTELYGKETHQRIIRELAVEKEKKVPIEADTLFESRTLGFEKLDEEERLFYDTMGDRYFTSTIARVLEAEYHLNRNFCLGMAPSLNDFYDFLGLEHTQYGDTVGWTDSNGDYYWIDFFHLHTDIDGTMDCWVITVDQMPTTDFLKDR
jgi:hypothetical protein